MIEEHRKKRKGCKKCGRDLQDWQDLFCSERCAKSYDWDLVGGDPSKSLQKEKSK